MDGEKLRPIIITGTPKSATKYIAVLLKQMGLDFEHEKLAKDGTADWRLAPGYKAVPWDGDTFLRNFNNPIILHQVRHPLNTIASCQKIAGYAWNYIYKFSPVNEYDYSEIGRCMALWYYWNKMAERLAIWTYRIEDLEKEFKLFCKKIERPELIKKKHIIKTIPKNINTAKPYKELTWEDLENEDSILTAKIKNLARRYGYKV